MTDTKTGIHIREKDRRKETELDILLPQLGHQWPPRDQAEAVEILSKSGNFSGERIEQHLAMAYPGFDGCDELPTGYTSTSADDGFPVFSAMLIEGLRGVVDDFNNRDPWHDQLQMQQWADKLDISSRTINRALPKLLRQGRAMRKTLKGAVSLRESAVAELKAE
ncbi:MAG: hypothetical protein ABGZ53_04435 [Fuerstiella sp.]